MSDVAQVSLAFFLNGYFQVSDFWGACWKFAKQGQRRYPGVGMACEQRCPGKPGDTAQTLICILAQYSQLRLNFLACKGGNHGTSYLIGQL